MRLVEDDNVGLAEVGIPEMGIPTLKSIIIPPVQLDAINSELDFVLQEQVLTQYIGIEKVKGVLANHGYHLEGGFVSMDTEYGFITPLVLQLSQDNLSTDYSVYYEWKLNDGGMYDVFASIVEPDELEELVNDYADETE